MRREPESLSPAREHGSHTLKVYTGTIDFHASYNFSSVTGIE